MGRFDCNIIYILVSDFIHFFIYTSIRFNTNGFGPIKLAEPCHVPVPTQESVQSCICVLEVSILLL